MKNSLNFANSCLKVVDTRRAALDALQAAIPQVTRVILRGVGHLAADNGGRPRLVAQELKTFLLNRCDE
jgi:hypothetical protein